VPGCASGHFYPKCFTVLPHIQPFIHRRRRQPCKVTTNTSGTPRHLDRRSPGIEPATFLLPDNRSYLLSYCHPKYCPTSICGQVPTVFVCATCRVIRCYQLVLLTTANLARTKPSTTKVFLEASVLVFRWNVVNSAVTSFPAPTSEANGTQHNEYHLHLLMESHPGKNPHVNYVLTRPFSTCGASQPTDCSILVSNRAVRSSLTSFEFFRLLLFNGGWIVLDWMFK